MMNTENLKERIIVGEKKYYFMIPEKIRMIESKSISKVTGTNKLTFE